MKYGIDVSRLYSEFAYATAGGSGIAKIVGEIIDDDGTVKREEYNKTIQEG